MLPVGFGKDARIENHDVAAVTVAANESPDALAKAHEGIGEGEFGEGITALHPALFAPGFADGMAGVFEGKAGDDNL